MSGARGEYRTFRAPVVCEWTTEGGICGCHFTDVPTFCSHVKEHYDHREGSIPATCNWKGCDFITRDGCNFTQHILFHPFHSYLKVLGTELQARLDLPACKIDEQYKNLVPPVPESLKCLWDDGKCVALFQNMGDFIFHVREHVMVQEAHACRCRWKGCSFEGRTRSKVLEHCRSHTGEKVAACPRCGIMFASISKFKDHLVRQGSVESSSFSCSVCYRVYSSERLLREHVRRHINTLKCPHCDLTCNGPSRLQHHIRFRHNTDTPHCCPVCQKGFKTTHCLNEHVVSHGQKRFECSINGCKYAGKTPKAWQSHMKKYHIPEQKQYSCHICCQCFVNGLQLSTHLKQIHGFSLPPGHSRFRLFFCKSSGTQC